MSKIKIALICGGRGSAQIIKALDQNRLVDLTLLVNAYDDGLSTGVLRNLIPDMLGPSDFRKNISHTLIHHRNPYNILVKFYEFRLQDFNKKFILEFLEKKEFFLIDNQFKSIKKIVTKGEYKLMIDSMKSICEYLLDRPENEYNIEMSVGNLIFAGIYLNNTHDFNNTVRIYCSLLHIKSKIVNVSDGENLKLIALRESGLIESLESDIVSLETRDTIKDLALVKPKELISIKNEKDFPKSDKIDYTKHASVEAVKAINKADIIIYGSGTLHSSIYPSLLILNEYIKTNDKALKVLVSNLEKDVDVKYVSNTNIIEKFFYYLKDPYHIYQTINFILQDSKSEPVNFDFTTKNLEIIDGNYRSKDVAHKHNGYFVSEQILELYGKSSQKDVILSVFTPESDPKEAVENLKSDLYDLSFKLNRILHIDVIYFKSPKDLINHISKFERADSKKLHFFTIIENRLNLNILDFYEGLKLAINESDSDVNVNFSRSALVDIDIANLKNLYNFRKSRIIFSRMVSFCISVLIAVRFNKFVNDPLCELKIYNFKSVKKSKILWQKINNANDLWVLLTKSEIFIDVPIEFFESARENYMYSRTKQTLGLLMSILKFK
jgi:2-phospho-L-lactate transferase/gluconeogenesis factor (CofD/UPF0052 family)